MSNRTPIISVIIPTYNRAVTLSRAINSVLAQTFADFELIIVDDGSTDDTQAVVAAIQDPRVHYLYQENRGVSAARNAGAWAATGCCLAFLDSDDEVLPQWLERLVDMLNAPQVGVVSCGVQVWGDGASSPRVELPRDVDPPRRGQKALFMSLTFAVRREIFWAVGGYAEPLHYSENTELGWRLLDYCEAQGWHVAHVDEALGIYRRARIGGSRHPRNFTRRLASLEYLLETHADRLRCNPRYYALCWSMAGVDATRLGQPAKARTYFREAVRLDGRNPRHRLRLLLSYVPVVREHFWLRHYK